MDDKKLYIKSRYKLWTTDQVRFCDLDALGHVNNNAMGTYFENARAKLFHLVTPGWPWGKTVFILARTCISFKHELNLPARLKVGTCITKIGTTSIHVANALYHAGKPISYSESISVLIDQKKRTPVRIPDDLRKVLKKYADGTNKA
ncbi:MAG: thioesterase family protein [Bdellovibrionales bacterium]